MNIQVQPTEFLIFLAAGCACAAVYAVFRLLGRFFKPNGLFEILSDLTSVILSGAVFLFCLAELTDGTLKYYFFLAYALSFTGLLFLSRKFNDILSRALGRFYSALKHSAPRVHISKRIKANIERAESKKKARAATHKESA
ncbi:MAG: hypothetical protein LBP79_01445 [Clostridiales bacterium]|jgi:nucleoside recognition membrane protein YjiH|nr:hypothetical protein [Clostridiales bacterium]